MIEVFIFIIPLQNESFNYDLKDMPLPFINFCKMFYMNCNITLVSFDFFLKIMDNCFYINCIKLNHINDTCIKPIKKQKNNGNKDRKRGIKSQRILFCQCVLSMYRYNRYRLSIDITLILRPICPKCKILTRFVLEFAIQQ